MNQPMRTFPTPELAPKAPGDHITPESALKSWEAMLAEIAKAQPKPKENKNA